MEVLDLEPILPHRPPILLLDRVIDLEPGVRGTGVRLFREGDACFSGHFPGRPILPGVLTIEALAQCLMVVLSIEARETPQEGPAGAGYLQRVQEMSFQHPITPGDEAQFAVAVERRLGRFVVAAGRVTVGPTLCAKGSLAVAMETSQGAAERN